MLHIPKRAAFIRCFGGVSQRGIYAIFFLIREDKLISILADHLNEYLLYSGFYQSLGKN